MNDNGRFAQLRIYFSEDTKCHGRSLAETLLLEVREANMSGATVVRGVMGFGAHGMIHSATLLRWTESLPLVLEIVDREERLRQLAERLEPCLKQCLVTIVPVEVIYVGEEAALTPSA